MDKEKLESGPNIHALGLSYIHSYLSREGYTIFEVNTDPNHHFQILAKKDNEIILVAVRTAYHPDNATIDKATQIQLIQESDQLNAIPHFAGLAIKLLETNYLEIDGCAGGKEYEVNFDGIRVVGSSYLSKVSS